MEFTWSRNQPRFDPASVAPASAASPAAASPDARTVVAGLLVKLYTYLVDNWRQHPQLANVIPAMSSAVKVYGAGLPGDPYAGVRAVVDLIKAEQRSDPSLPLP